MLCHQTFHSLSIYAREKKLSESEREARGCGGGVILISIPTPTQSSRFELPCSPCIRQLLPQYVKTIQMIVLWPLLIVNLWILGLIWWGTSHFVQNKELLSYMVYVRVAWRWCQIRSLEVSNAFSWIFDAVPSEKSCLTSMLFLLIYIELRTVELFPPTESWLANSNFRRGSLMQGSMRALNDRMKIQENRGLCILVPRALTPVG